MTTGERKDPFRGFNFKLEIEGLGQAGFHECSGLDAVTDHSLQKITGINKNTDITLKRGVVSSASLVNWLNSARAGRPQKKNGTIVLMDQAGNEKARWNFTQGWPTKWTGPTLNATANEVAIEALEITHQGVTKKL